MQFPAPETFGQSAARVAVGLMLLAGAGFVIAAGHGSRRLSRFFLTGAATLLVIVVCALAYVALAKA